MHMDKELRYHVIHAVTLAWQRVNSQKVTFSDVMGGSRQRAIVSCRQLCMYILRKHYEWSLMGIGEAFGMNHATVIHACKAVITSIEMNHSDAVVLSQALSALNAIRDGNLPPIEDLSLSDLYEREKAKCNRQLIEVAALRSQLKDANRKLKDMEALLSKFEDKEYVRPMNWTADERRRLKEWRRDGGENVLCAGTSGSGSVVHPRRKENAKLTRN